MRAWADKHDQPILVTEYGADTISGLHSARPVLYSEEYQTALLDTYHRVFDRIDAVVGEHVWNFADFQTGTSFIRVDGNKKGVFTRDRRYLNFAWRLFRYSLLVALLVFALMIIERVAVIPV